MSRRMRAPSPTGMPQEEAEEFMALLLEAQTGTHNCPFARYFRKVIIV